MKKHTQVCFYCKFKEKSLLVIATKKRSTAGIDAFSVVLPIDNEEMTMNLSEEEVLSTVSNIQRSGYAFSYDYKKHKIVVMDEAGEEAVHLRLPITFPPLTETVDIDEYAVNYIILLVQSGSSALGYCEGEDMMDHKVFKSYMVRKKQGKSQVKYLNTKGKSRAGSRVRLANTLQFFENINERLQEYFEENQINRIAINCSKTLIPYLFNSKVDCPFEKTDKRLYKIPKHVHAPGYDVLLDAHEFLQAGELVYDEKYQSIVDVLVGDESNHDA